MTTYSIDDQHGTNICGGIQLEHKARETAQEYANDLGAPVLLYSNEPGDEGETIEPTAEAITDKQIETLSVEAAQHGDLEQVAICDRALAGDEAARSECVRAIRNAEAQADG